MNKEYKDNIILEKPITTNEEDIYGSNVYANQIFDAINEGAKFIAIDGKYGTGKSSILELFKKKASNKKNIFIDINFININIDKNGDANNYHRYFVNQVGSVLYKNPYDLERTFYQNYFSYSIKSLKDSKFKKLLSRFLTFLIILLFIYVTYGTFFSEIEKLKSIYELWGKFMPLIIIMIVALILCLGFGFYKPENEETSPMLEIDKCKNNLLKVIYNKVRKGNTIYFIIDDLDRVAPDMQLKVISLLYNEYYNLDKTLNKINVVFLFLIDLKKIENNEDNELNSYKLFDYSVNISNNDPMILKNYIEQQIYKNDILSEIFSNIKNKDYFIGIISNNYDRIRKVKHLLNRIITKYIYLKNKGLESINYSELIAISILSGMMDIQTIQERLNNIVYLSKPFDDDGNELNKLMLELYRKDAIDNSYYIYLSDFIDVDNLLNPNEQIIYEVVNDPFSNEEDWIKVYDILENKQKDINYTKIYNQVYKYASDYDKILLNGDEKFHTFLVENYDNDIVMDDIYKVPNINIKYSNYIKNKLINNNSFKTLDDLYLNYIESNEDNSLDSYLKELKQYINGLKNNIKYYNLSKYLIDVPIDDELFSLIYEQKEDNVSVIYEMLVNGKLDFNLIKDHFDINKIDDIESIKDKDLKRKLFEILLESDIDIKIKKKIFFVPEFKFERNYERILSEIKESNITLSTTEIIYLLEVYGYRNQIDDFLIQVVVEKSVIDFIREKEFNLSNNILDSINSNTTKYEFNTFYNNLFRERKYYRLYIYSNAIKRKEFVINSHLKNKIEYINDINNVFQNMNTSFKKYKFSKNFIDIILDTFDFSKIKYNENNYWKLDNLIPEINEYEKSIKIFDELNNQSILNSYARHLKKLNNDNNDILDFLKRFSQEKRLSKGTKISISKIIGKNNK